MSRQLPIDIFFKSKASPTATFCKLDVKPNMVNKASKKRNLSLIKSITPTKIPKIYDENRNEPEVIDLSSDDEDIWENTLKTRLPCVDLTQRSNDSEEVVSDSSVSTVIYSPRKSFHSPSTPRNNIGHKTPKKEPLNIQNFEQAQLNTLSQSTQKSIERPIEIESCHETNEIPQSNLKSFQTPKKSQQPRSATQSSQASSHESPQSREKFFSPMRKRSVVKRSPNKAIRSLNSELTKSIPSRILFEDDLFANACEGMDDKTTFLLQIINQYLNTPSLRHLLDTELQGLLTKCLQVVKPGMRLVCRLYWRKEGWYKKDVVSQISSEEAEPIDDNSFNEMITSLVDSGLLVQSSTHNITFDHFISILKKDDLIDICKELKIYKNSKQDAIEALRSFSKRSSNISNFIIGPKTSNYSRVLKMMNVRAGSCYKLSDLARNALYKLYIIMYLGMDYNIIREKKLELTLIYDKIKRETYPINKEMPLDNASVVFKSKDDFERYLTAHRIYEDYNICTDVNAKCGMVKQVYRLYGDISEDEMECYTSQPQWLHRYTPASIYVKILESGIQELKKDKQGSHYTLALDILDLLIAQNTFRQHHKAEWYAEKAHILHSCLSRYDEAAEVLIEGFKSDLSEEAKDSMRPRATKIANQKNITLSEHLKMELLEHGTKAEILENNFGAKHIDKQPMEQIGKRGKVKFETRTPEGRLVQEAEEYCITHYICSGEFTHGEHWEGRIVKSLFFLLFWDIIYSKPRGVRGVFLSHYQLYPLDLFTDSFYTNRKDAIDDWLRVIEMASEEKLSNIMQETWSNRPEQELSELCRGFISMDKLKFIASCLKPAGLAALCRRLATDYRYANSGFPDLTLWHAHTKKIKFVEVKTDTDKPSLKQLQWMRYLRESGVEAEFCYVGTHTHRQRCRAHAPHKPHKPRAAANKPKRQRKKKTPQVVSQSILKTELKKDDEL